MRTIEKRNSLELIRLNKRKLKKDKYDEITYRNVEKALIGLLEKVLDYEEKEGIIGSDRKSFYKTDKDATAMAVNYSTIE